MKDPRIQTLAHNLIHYSTALKPGEKVLIEVNGFEVPLTTALIDEAYAVGAVPFEMCIRDRDGDIQAYITIGLQCCFGKLQICHISHILNAAAGIISGNRHGAIVFAQLRGGKIRRVCGSLHGYAAIVRFAVFCSGSDTGRTRSNCGDFAAAADSGHPRIRRLPGDIFVCGVRRRNACI